MDQPSAAAAAAAAAFLLNTYLIIFVGFVIATVLYGITLLQALFYFRTYTKDPWYLKLLTALVIGFDTMTTVLPAHAIYYYLIKNFGNYAAGVSEPMTYRVENLMLTMITFLVQSFYTHQIWKLSRSKPLVIFLGSLVIITLGLGLEITVDIIQNATAAHLASNRILIVGGFVQGLAALCDITITASLCWLLHTRRTGIKRTEKLVDRLIILSVNRGLVTTVAQICFLVLNVSVPGKIYWFPFHQAVGKLYTNSYLAMLNIRLDSNRINNAATADTQVTSLRFETRRQNTSELGTGPSTTRFGSRGNRSLGDLELSKITTNSQDFPSVEEAPPIPTIQRMKMTGRDVDPGQYI